MVIPVLLATVEKISAVRLHVPKDLRPLATRETLWKAVLEVQRRFAVSMPMLDPVKNMKISDKLFQDLVWVRHSQISPSAVLTPLTRIENQSSRRASCEESHTFRPAMPSTL
jgi:hypothetical protein